MTWRVNDTVMLSQLRASLAELEALLLRRPQSADDRYAVLDELRRIRETTLAIDGFDRDAIRRQSARLEARVDELRAESA